MIKIRPTIAGTAGVYTYHKWEIISEYLKGNEKARNEIAYATVIRFETMLFLTGTR